MKTKIVQKENAEEVTVEIIAQSIKEISDGVKKLRAGKLNDKALLFLIGKSSGIKIDTVKAVLVGMQNLEKEFLK